MAYNLEPRTIKENLLGLIGNNPHAEPRPAKTREECFLADIAENGGGGSSLPPYTSADKGKGLFLGDGEPEEKYIISPQTATLDGNGDPAVLPVGSYDFSEVSNGDTLTLILNGVTTQITAASGYGYDFIYNHESEGDTVQIAYSAEQGCGFNYLRRSGDTSSQVAGNYQLSISKAIPSVEPKWEAPAGGGALIVTVSYDPVTLSIGGVEYTGYAASASISDIASASFAILVIAGRQGGVAYNYLDSVFAESAFPDTPYTGYDYTASFTQGAYVLYSTSPSGTAYIIVPRT